VHSGGPSFDPALIDLGGFKHGTSPNSKKFVPCFIVRRLNTELKANITFARFPTSTAVAFSMADAHFFVLLGVVLPKGH
jgi:hypothetical protein